MSQTTEYQLLVFDWDGTLCDSSAIIVNAVKAAIKDVGLTQYPTDEDIKMLIGIFIYPLFQSLYPNLDHDAYQQLSDRYQHHYLATSQKDQLFTGAYDTLQQLKKLGYELAIATAKSRSGLIKALNDTDLKPMITAFRCGDDDYSKPHPQMLLGLMQECDTHPAQTLMIGDSTYDMELARNAGVASIAVSYGIQPLSALLPYQPVGVIDDISQIITWLHSRS